MGVLNMDLTFHVSRQLNCGMFLGKINGKNGQISNLDQIFEKALYRHNTLIDITGTATVNIYEFNNNLSNVIINDARQIVCVSWDTFGWYGTHGMSSRVLSMALNWRSHPRRNPVFLEEADTDEVLFS